METHHSRAVSGSRPLAAGSPAPYGRACVDCARSKCKCIVRTPGGACERCYRLNRECRPAPTVRAKHARRTAASKAIQLEQKLDNIVQLLKNNNQLLPATAESSDESLNHSSTKDSSPSATSFVASTYGSYNHVSNSAINSLNFAPTLGLPEPLPTDGEECLHDFRTHKLPFVPFIHIPPTTSSEQLFRERPFLWYCIVLASTKSRSQQEELPLKVRTMLSEAMVIGQEHNLDLLLGVLVCVAWCVNDVRVKKPSLAVFTQLAISLVFQLGLNKPPGSSFQTMLFNCKINAPEASRQLDSAVRTLEERRAILGCFLITSFVSAFLRYMDPLRWTPHMNECLEVLAEAKEFPTDDTLIQLVRMQLIVDKAVHFSAQHGEVASNDFSRIPPALYRLALQGQLQEVEKNLSGNVQHEVVLLHLHSTALYISELGILKSAASANNTDFQDVECLYASLRSLKSWLDIFFTIPPARYTGIPFSIFSQFMRCLVVLYRLSAIDDPGWDKQVARNTYNVAEVLRMVSTNLLASDVYPRYAETFNATRERWEAKLAALSINTAAPVVPETDLEMPNLSMDLPENWWVSDVFSAWDF
ncbi:uncharacterized protein BDZ99DRAFT_439292 [Mytilinidion resinicola]|uniref:Zn(2)-C6 fungal-type domain-containing protein n=1 Tax=Mytilinidion resinicola TaxID=574789 RepID=A0A6A6YWK9_9PEZI|nr:uncharacterized protein BDZ99DRAFT_439292 [Mytilinidion resinicola]KAF2812287.1 hypothetical protein BDZ99DRAFT_439292 [Mytilinidion resinicola]